MPGHVSTVDQYYQQIQSLGAEEDEILGVTTGIPDLEIKSECRKPGQESPAPFRRFSVSLVSDNEVRVFSARLKKIVNESNAFSRDKGLESRQIAPHGKEGVTREEAMQCLATLQSSPKYYHDTILNVLEKNIPDEQTAEKNNQVIVLKAAKALDQELSHLQKNPNFNRENFNTALSLALESLSEKYQHTSLITDVCTAAALLKLDKPTEPLLVPGDKAAINSKNTFSIRTDTLLSDKIHKQKNADRLFDLLLGVMDYGSRHEQKNTHWAQSLVDRVETQLGQPGIQFSPSGVTRFAQILPQCEKSFPGLNLEALRTAIDGKQFDPSHQSYELITYHGMKQAVIDETGNLSTNLLDVPMFTPGETRGQWNERIQQSSISPKKKQIIETFLLQRTDWAGNIIDTSRETLGENKLISGVTKDIQGMANWVREYTSTGETSLRDTGLDPLPHELLQGKVLQLPKGATFEIDKNDILWSIPDATTFNRLTPNLSGCIEMPESGFEHYYFFADGGRLQDIRDMVLHLEGKDQNGQPLYFTNTENKKIPIGSDVYSAAIIARKRGGVLVSRPIK